MSNDKSRAVLTSCKGPRHCHQRFCPLTYQMNALLIYVMGRIAGVTAAETRERLLRAAADVFAERGYDGTRVADIAAAAGVSNGALYATSARRPSCWWPRCARTGRSCWPTLVAADPTGSIADLLLAVGRRLPAPSRRPRLPHRRGARGGPPRRGRRPADARLRRRARRLARRAGARRPGRRRAGRRAVAGRASPTSACCWRWAARSSRPDLHAVDDEEWAALLTRVVDRPRPARHHRHRAGAPQ